ncbi:GNAT family N-acetyltransferase [Paenibacillus sp. SN-8-1]|uniref:GNAT family N-acetyltransferase n=1 Tax=Paenibacillus sp. SN-8-1 TaxID=3435409 RepID=UPI003D9A660D
MLKIRAYESGDVAVMAELMGELGYPTSVDQMNRRMSRIMNNKEYQTYVAVIDDTVVGMIGIRIALNYELDKEIIQIISLVTKSAFRGRGVGRALIKFAEQKSIEQGAEIIYLTSGIKAERMEAHDFYKAKGFEINGYRFVKALK